jgi:hypothetical protein
LVVALRGSWGTRASSTSPWRYNMMSSFQGGAYMDFALMRFVC